MLTTSGGTAWARCHHIKYSALAQKRLVGPSSGMSSSVSGAQGGGGGAGSTTATTSADKVTGAVMPGDRMHAVEQAIRSCRKGGTISVPGVYIGFVDKLPFGPAMNKGITFKMGQTHMQRYMRPLLQKIEKHEIDPSFVITQEIPIEAAPEWYKKFRDKQDGCIKVVIRPNDSKPN